MKELIVTENHLKLLKNLHVGWDYTEFGAPCIDPKRPFGNSNVFSDMAQILGFELANHEKQPELYDKQCTSLVKGYHELQYCLQILCTNLKLESGKYVLENEYDVKSWRKVND